MGTSATKKEEKSKVVVVRKMIDYSKESVFKKKIEDAKSFIKEKGLPNSFLNKENQ
jgi:hypothetical protein